MLDPKDKVKKGIGDLCHNEAKKIQDRISGITEFLNDSTNNGLIKVSMMVINTFLQFLKFARAYLKKDLSLT